MEKQNEVIVFINERALPRIVECKYNPITDAVTAYKGSVVRTDSVPSQSDSDARHYGPTRDRLISEEVIAEVNGEYVFTRDYTFSSPSGAASVILGRPSNGRKNFWITDNTTLGAVYPWKRLSERVA